jgi:hypothetical protein
MIRRILAGSLALCGVQSQAFAGDNLIIELPLLGYSSKSSEVKPDEGDKVKETTTGTSTADLSTGYFRFSIEDLQVYVYPFAADKAKKVSVGYMFGPVEAGVNIGVANEKQKEAKTSSYESLYGIYGTYYAKLASDLDLEVDLSFDSTSSKSKDLDEKSGELTKTHTTGTDLGLGLGVVKGITKHISYVGGLTYNLKTGEDKETKAKTTNNVWAVNFASFRYTFN